MLRPDRSPAARTYNLLLDRVARIVASPHSRKIRAAVVARRPSENPDDWQRLIRNLSATAGVTLQFISDCQVLINWADFI
ncbi:DUF1654 domain-containing protein [Pseudomonas urethralis]|uniref:DUF1654 domain-containing protein n=1 Tax=Pseudomonas urethralis TaxID=2740517 RepID=UPI001596956F